MTTLRTMHKRARRALRRRVLVEAFNYDLARYARLAASGRLDKRKPIYFVRKYRRASLRNGAVTPPIRSCPRCFRVYAWELGGCPVCAS